MPYRIDLRVTDAGVFDRLIDLGALDAEVLEASGGRMLAALLPDSVPPEQVVQALGLENVQISTAVGRDAGSVWVLSPRPVEVAGIQLVPASMPAGPDAIRLIDTAAFGTGMHPTTALCLEALAEAIHPSPPEALLDVGTGSGVLALAALRMGVARALAIDIEEAALAAAAENARINALDARLSLARGGPEAVAGTWPLAVANVLAAPLIEMAPALVRRVGHHGRLILSGIPASVEPDVHRAYRHLGMTRLSVTSRAGWVALVLHASW